MRVKTSPNPSISLPPSTPPRFGPRGAPLWAFALLTAFFAGDLKGQGLALSATKYGEDYAVSGSLWLGVQPNLYGTVAYSNSPWVSDHYVFSNYVNERRGHGLGRGRGHAWGHYKKLDCGDLFWDPWAWSWAGCGPYWRSAYAYHRYGWVRAVPVWAPYPVYAVPAYPKSRPYHAYRDHDDDYYYDNVYYDDDYYDDYAYREHDHDGWSVDVYVSIGLGHSVYYPSRWYPRYVTRGPVYVDPWYDPWPSRHTIVFVDPGPRWVVNPTPRYVRAEPSPRIGSGGWVSQVGFKESPRGNAPARTAVARPAPESSGVSRQAAGAGAPFASPSPSRAGSAEPRVARGRVADTPSLDARANEARPSRATAAAPSRTPAAALSRAEPEPTPARGRVEAPRDGSAASVRAPRPSSGRVLTAPSPSVERRRPQPSAAPFRAPVRAEPQRAEPQRAEPRGRVQPQARPEPQARVETRERAVSQVRAEPRARTDQQSQVRAEPRGRSDRQSQVRAEPRVAEPRAPGRAEPRAAVRAEPRAQAAPSREPRGGAPQASPQRDARSVRPQAAPSTVREPRVSRPSQGAGSSGAGPSGARGRASR